MIYLDTSAAVKTLVLETGTDAVREAISGDAELVSSRLLAIELHAVADRRRLDPGPVRALLGRVSLVRLDDEILDLAIVLRSGLRTLDALHLATALHLGEIVTGYLGFDKELTAAIARQGIPLHPAGS